MNKYLSSLLYSTVTLSSGALLLAYIFELSLWLGFVIVLVVGASAQLIHMPEELPGGADNPDGETVHPYVVITYAVVLLLITIGIAGIFPEIMDSPGFRR